MGLFSHFLFDRGCHARLAALDAASMGLYALPFAWHWGL
jgi:hypothetical protein